MEEVPEDVSYPDKTYTTAEEVTEDVGYAQEEPRVQTGESDRTKETTRVKKKVVKKIVC